MKFDWLYAQIDAIASLIEVLLDTGMPPGLDLMTYVNIYVDLQNDLTERRLIHDLDAWLEWKIKDDPKDPYYKDFRDAFRRLVSI